MREGHNINLISEWKESYLWCYSQGIVNGWLQKDKLRIKHKRLACSIPRGGMCPVPRVCISIHTTQSSITIKGIIMHQTGSIKLKHQDTQGYYW